MGVTRYDFNTDGMVYTTTEARADGHVYLDEDHTDEQVHATFADGGDGIGVISGSAREIRNMLLHMLAQVEAIDPADPAYEELPRVADPRVPVPFIRDVARVRGIDIDGVTDRELAAAALAVSIGFDWVDDADDEEDIRQLATVADRAARLATLRAADLTVR